MKQKTKFFYTAGLVSIMALAPLRTLADPPNQHFMTASPAESRLLDEFEPYQQRDSIINRKMDDDIRKRNYQAAIRDSLRRIDTDRKIVIELAHRSESIKVLATGQLNLACVTLGELYEYKRDYVRALMYYCEPWFVRNTGEIPTEFSTDSRVTTKLVNKRSPFSEPEFNARFQADFGGSTSEDLTQSAVCYYHLGNYGMVALASAIDKPASQVEVLYKKLKAANVWNLPSNQAKQISGASGLYLKMLVNLGWPDLIGERLAIHRLKDAIRLDPGNASLWATLGETYDGGLDFNEATVKNLLMSIAAYKQAAKLAPSNAQYWANIGGTYEGIDQMLEQQTDTSQEIKQLILYGQAAIAADHVALSLKYNNRIVQSIASLQSEIKSWQDEYNIVLHKEEDAALQKH